MPTTGRQVRGLRSTPRQRYVTLHPGSPDAAYAQYLIGSSYFDQIPDVTRDQERTEKAMAALEEVVRKYPELRICRRRAKRKIEMARDQLAGKEMEIGRYYMERRDYIGAINRFKVVVTRYQTTRHVEEALLRLTEAYMALGIVDEAQTAAAVLGHNFPDSRWYKDAYDLVQSAGLQPQREQGLLDQPRRSRRSGWADARSRANLLMRTAPAIRVIEMPNSMRTWMPGTAVRAVAAVRCRTAAMLARLSIRDIVLIDRLDIDFAVRPVGADRRDRRRQIDPARRLCAGARRPRRRRAGAPWRRAGAGDRGLRPSRRPSRARAAGGERHPSRGRIDPAPRAVRRWPHPRLRQRSAGERAGAARRSARRWSRSTASTTNARWSTRRPIAALLDAFGGLESEAPRSSALWEERRAREAEVAAHRAEVERAQPRGRLAAPCGRGACAARAASRRGDRACRAARRHDAGGEGRRRFARCARGGRRARNRRCRRCRRRCAGWSAAPRRRRR